MAKMMSRDPETFTDKDIDVLNHLLMSNYLKQAADYHPMFLGSNQISAAYKLVCSRCPTINESVN